MTPPEAEPVGGAVRRLAARFTPIANQVFSRRSPGDRAPVLGLIAWGQRYLPAHFTRPPSKMHLWLGDQLDAADVRRGARVNLVGPRGGAKSTIGTLAYVLRSAVERRSRYIWVVSDTRSQAQTHLENIKCELAENASLRAAYGAACDPGRRWHATGVELASGVVIESYGAGQRIRGRRRRERRPDLIVCDDLENDAHTASARLRDASRAWFEGTLLPAGAAETNVVNLATALHRDALAMRLDATPGWRSARFRAVERWPDRADLWDTWRALYTDAGRPDAAQAARRFYEAHAQAMDAGAELLWPDAEGLEALMRLRVELGEGAFEREKQSSPVDPARCEWPESYFGDAVWFDDWPEGLRLKALALDPSKGSGARLGDYSAYVLLGVGAGGVLYVDADLARRPTPRMVADGVDLMVRFRPDVFGVEANQWQQLLAGEFAGEVQRRGLVGAPLVEVHNHVPKQVRIRRLGPYLSQGRLRFRSGSPGARMLVDQLRDFPLAAHDDGPDALEMALRLAEEAWRARGP